MAKPRICIATIGHEKHGKTTLTQAMALERITNVEERKILVQQFSSNKRAEYETNLYSFSHVDCSKSTTKSVLLEGDELDGCILVVDAQEGPMPQTREHIELAKQAGITRIVVFISKCDLVPDKDMLEIIEADVRELLSYYGYDGAKTPIIGGAAKRAIQGDSKWRQNIRKLIDSVCSWIPESSTPPKGHALSDNGLYAQMIYRLTSELYKSKKEQYGQILLEASGNLKKYSVEELRFSFDRSFLSDLQIPRSELLKQLTEQGFKVKDLDDIQSKLAEVGREISDVEQKYKDEEGKLIASFGDAGRAVGGAIRSSGSGTPDPKKDLISAGVELLGYALGWAAERAEKNAMKKKVADLEQKRDNLLRTKLDQTYRLAREKSDLLFEIYRDLLFSLQQAYMTEFLKPVGGDSESERMYPILRRLFARYVSTRSLFIELADFLDEVMQLSSEAEARRTGDMLSPIQRIQELKALLKSPPKKSEENLRQIVSCEYALWEQIFETMKKKNVRRILAGAQLQRKALGEKK